MVSNAILDDIKMTVVFFLSRKNKCQQYNHKYFKKVIGLNSIQIFVQNV